VLKFSSRIRESEEFHTRDIPEGDKRSAAGVLRRTRIEYLFFVHAYPYSLHVDFVDPSSVHANRFSSEITASKNQLYGCDRTSDGGPALTSICIFLLFLCDQVIELLRKSAGAPCGSA
jgi:hypothetical protein